MSTTYKGICAFCGKIIEGDVVGFGFRDWHEKCLFEYEKGKYKGEKIEC